MAENIRVVVRFRPINKREAAEQKQQGLKDLPIQWNTNDDTGFCQTCTLPQLGSKDKITFSFDAILNNVPQQMGFEHVALKTCQDALNGYNGTIFAYGQTGSGKTFSMLGDESDPMSTDKMGMIPRAVSYIFNEIQENTSIIEANVKVQFVEIYKEALRDLLDPTNKALALKMNKQGDTIITNLTSKLVTTLLDVLQLIEIASNYRTRANTSMNATSSRSHMVMIIVLKLKYRDEVDPDSFTIKYGKINFADLAGSEKVRKTGVTGQRLKEAQKINLSLTMLGQAISALAKGRSHIPYRDSLLTHLLKDSLGGNCKTTLLLCCSPHIFNRDETINSMRFGSRCKMIKNKAKVNKIYTNAQLLKMVEQLKEKNKLLQKKLKQKKKKKSNFLSKKNESIDSVDFEIDESKLEIDLKKLNEEFKIKEELCDELEQKNEGLKRELADLNDSYEELQDEIETLIESTSQEQVFKQKSSKWTINEMNNIDENLNDKYNELKEDFDKLKISLVLTKKNYKKLQETTAEQIETIETNADETTQRLQDENFKLKQEVAKLKRTLHRVQRAKRHTISLSGSHSPTSPTLANALTNYDPYNGVKSVNENDGIDIKTNLSVNTVGSNNNNNNDHDSTDYDTDDEDYDIKNESNTKFKNKDVGNDDNGMDGDTTKQMEQFKQFIKMQKTASSTNLTGNDELLKKRNYLLEMAKKSKMNLSLMPYPSAPMGTLNKAPYHQPVLYKKNTASFDNEYSELKRKYLQHKMNKKKDKKKKLVTFDKSHVKYQTLSEIDVHDQHMNKIVDRKNSKKWWECFGCVTNEYGEDGQTTTDDDNDTPE